MKDTWKEYFSFNKQQRNGILLLLAFIILLIVYLFIADYFPSKNNPVDFSSFKNEIQNSGIKSPVSNEKGNASVRLIDINSADTEDLMTLPKMTSYCASMIVRYRKKLGGYYSIKQLKEVWGMDSSMFKALAAKVKTDSAALHKININSADIKQLAFHPYIRYYLAKAIVNYRDEHGLFASLAALHKMAAIDDSTYAKIVPYLTVGNRK
ncbi:MAG TPA: helix-hairpin-helix domain-containing protein [Bacteroidia bacterium]|jgi:competence protein ComEA|nr:helix-hairpin-helix domain-containing protein [Bacteroidia bacterium]